MEKKRNPTTKKFVPLDPLEYLFAHCDKHEHCWVWNGQVNRKTGFGIFKCVAVSKSTMNAHRASWILHKGPIELRSTLVLQFCGNKLCINPEHLFLGSVKESMAIANNRHS